MASLLVVALFIVIAVHDSAAARVPPSPDEAPIWLLASTVLAGHVAVVLIAWAMLLRTGARLAREGHVDLVRRARTTSSVARHATVGVFIAAVLWLGWLDAVRASIGDLVLIDELIVLTPPIVALVALWWAGAPVERLVREAALFGALDRGDRLLEPPTRWGYTVEQTRRHILASAIPLTILTGWWEGTELIAMSAPERDAGWVAPALFATQVAGLALLAWIMPLLLTTLWPTVPLGPGPLRDRLIDLCRARGLRTPRLRVWRTTDGLINGALVGVAPPFRAILLTDALLERLPLDQVEAVMAHEVAHARRRHLPWLIGIVGLSAGVCYMAAAAVWGAPGQETVRLVAAIAGATLVFGWVSRRFELQADAFAAQHLSRATPPDDGAPVTITPHAAGAMAGALVSVARLNGVHPGRFTFRHGSIAARVDHLQSLVGTPAARTPIDGVVRRIKTSAIALGLILGALAALG